MRPDKEIEKEAVIFEKLSSNSISTNTDIYTLHNLFTDMKSLKLFGEFDLKLFRKKLCELDIIKLKNHSYHITEKSTAENILKNGDIQKNKHGYTYYQIIVTDYGREYIINKFRKAS